MQRASPAAATEPQQFVDAVHSGSGGQDLDGYASRRELRPKTGIGPHTAERAASDDEPLRATVQQRAEILQAQHVTLAPPPVFLHPARCKEYVRADLMPVHYQFPEAVPVDTHTPELRSAPLRGQGPEVIRLLGSASRYAATRAPCPVVVVREAATAAHREIVVGVRDPQDATEALAFAFEEAALRGAELVAAHAWNWFPPALGGPAGPGDAGCPADPGKISAEAGRNLAEGLTGMAGQVPRRARPA